MIKGDDGGEDFWKYQFLILGYVFQPVGQMTRSPGSVEKTEGQPIPNLFTSQTTFTIPVWMLGKASLEYSFY